MHRIILAFVPMVALLPLARQATAADDTNRTFYDASGRVTGTASTSGGTTTYRDAMGRTTGSATRLPDGRTEFRNSRGRVTGTSSTSK
jgi:YD repeat-containing protein